MGANHWKEAQLADLIDIIHGFAFKGEYFREEPPGDILLTPGNFAIGGGFKGDKLKYYDGPVPEDYVLDEGDLLVTMTDLSKVSDTLGYPSLVPKASPNSHFLHNQRLGKVLVNPDAPLHKEFLYYLLCSHPYRHEVLASATGTTVKHTSPDRIKAFRFALPPLDEQKEIAHILGTLDDKIALNQQMNRTLEGIARALFKSWFIDFGPVRAKLDGRQPADMDAETAALFPDSFEDSNLGEIPKGWKVGKLGDLAEVIMGASPKGDTYNEDGIGIPLVNGPVEFGDYFLIKRKWTTAPTRLTQLGDLVFCVRGSTTGRRVIADDIYCLGRGVCAIRGLANNQIFINQTIELGLERLLAKTTGSVFPNLGSSAFKEFEILNPTDSVVHNYCKLVKPLRNKIEANIYEKGELQKIRDALLPKLLSGYA
ncbi:restriction endonuclease subunit S [Phormidium tenue]|uniref:Type I restriction modification DNA specificity domain-containing protein n=1 Tax=Phormidium tenue NIES-30 TaxID=549789 RepID=A0A1U7J914_9CYAN|nr:restriction endonuclease subunit S [Phormidium tenue]MBD2230969.1 restriction endonuclease subunit S [Phormidium tenue FACHB-1052]OKH49996.1 hypothetical protein NIES30_04610 [Phormidium tenue NIES-30]